MNYTTKLSLIITSFVFVAILTVAIFSFTSQAMAWAGGTDDGQGGCCGSDSGSSGGGSSETPTTLNPTTGGNSTPDPTPAAVCHYLNANPTTVPYGGGTVNLTWSTSNASSVSISGIGNVGATNTTGHPVNVSSNTTFTLTASSAGGSSNCTVSIAVNPPPTPAPQCLSFTANKNVVNTPGETVTLTWSTQNATSVSINQGIGNVTPVANGTHSVFVSSNTTYTLTVNGDGGQTSCAVSITTQTSHTPTPSCNYLRADTDDFDEFGDEITLSWSTTNADQVTINPRPGRVSSSGNEEVAIYDERTTFTLTARNTQYGTQATCSVSVRLDEEEEDEKTPRCELEVSKTRVNKGDRVTLSWETDYADEIRIRDDRGNTIFDTKDYSSSQRKRYLDGEIDVVINRSTEFTLNAYGDGGNRSCEVEVKTDDLAVYENRDQGYVIALTQVPYTGFEAGPFLTFLFYAVLTLWALFIAYVLVIKKSSILGFSLYGNAGHSAANEADIANRKKVEALVAKYSGQNQN